MSELAVYEEKPLTAQDVRAHVNLIQEVMKAVMIDGQHYGKIPGAGDKPTLLKPGAEKIMATFKLSVDPEVEDLSFEDIIRYRVKCKLYAPSGRMVGAGIGECSTEEEKYKWRFAVAEEEYAATPETHKRIKYKRDGKTIKQVRTNPFDIANTVLKMAKKRALVDAVLTTTAASDIFEQDIEDLPEDIITLERHEARPTITPPQEKQTPAATPPTTPTDFISDLQAKRFYAIAKGKGWKDEALKKWLMANFEIDSTKKIKKTQYENIVLEIESIEAPNA